MNTSGNKGQYGMNLSLCSLSSGSSGNVTYIAAGKTRLLVDAGLTGKRITELLGQIGVLPEMLNGILVTHEHVDHVRGVGVLARKYRIPVYANEKTWEAMYRQVGEVAPWQRRVFNTEEDFYVDDLAVMPFGISHDTVEPVAFRLFYGGRSVAVATDMGTATKKVIRNLEGADLVLLESNHDPLMVMNNTCYPYRLKQRILGNKGHLSNEDCALTLLKLGETGVRHALLGHLSRDNNTPQLAMDTVCASLHAHGVAVGRDIALDMTWRDRIGGTYTIE
jgi:phosphoribosyl 1,2-cyclic phosphodiesterase